MTHVDSKQHYISLLLQQTEDRPWYGKSIRELLIEPALDLSRDQEKDLIKLLIHMTNWKVYAIQKLQMDQKVSITLNTDKDWPSDTDVESSIYKEVLSDYLKVHNRLIEIVKSECSAYFINQPVPGCEFDFKYLLDGIIHHDIYHLGQIAMIVKRANPQSPA